MAKSRIHSVLTALPVIMLGAGLWYYYSGEQKQRNSPFLLEQTETLAGQYAGLSSVGSGSWGRNYFWVATADSAGNTRKRSVRITGDEALYLSMPKFKEQVALEKGDSIVLHASPTVEGSAVLWLQELREGDRVVLTR